MPALLGHIKGSLASNRGPALAVEGLTKRFGDRVAFEDVSFEVGRGEVFGFLGPNGAGKTTTVRVLGTLLSPSAGSAIVAGLPLAPDNGVEIRRRISIMPEAPGLYLRLSVFENLECFAGLYELPDARARVERALRAVNLTDRANDPCGALSKGLRQRVARALLNEPQTLFLDEPTSGLDPVAAREVHELVEGLRQSGVTIFLITHRPQELRDRLFAKTLEVRTRVPLPEPDRIFSGLPAVDAWRRDGNGAYLLTVSDPLVAAPAATRALVAAGVDVLSIASPTARWSTSTSN
jgi:ABC-2 type transport system ATP-binding protein